MHYVDKVRGSRDNAVGIATPYALDRLVFKPGGDEVFLAFTKQP